MKKLILIGILITQSLFGHGHWTKPVNDIRKTLTAHKVSIDSYKTIIESNTKNQAILFKLTQDNAEVNKELMKLIKSLNERILLLETENKALRKGKIKEILTK